MVFLVRYGELALKSPYVRRQLEDRLAANVRAMFAANDTECVLRVERGRLFLHADDEPGALRLLRRVFGIVSISAAKEMPSDLESLTRGAIEYARDLLKSGMSFAIRPRRSGQHPYTSQDLARVLGKAIQENVPGLAVDLDGPDYEIHVEARGPRAYLFHEVVEGPGGLPLGSQGDVLAPAYDEAGMVATWLVMRRGCRARVAGREPFLAALRQWDPKLEILTAASPSDFASVAVVKGLPLVMPSVAETQVAGAFALRPLAGLADGEVRELATRIRKA